MPLAGRAREQGERAATAPPAARESEQAAPQHVAREVLLRDRELASNPALTERSQHGKDDVGEHRAGAEDGQQPVEQRVGRTFVVPLERRQQLGARLGQPRCRWLFGPRSRRDLLSLRCPRGLRG